MIYKLNKRWYLTAVLLIILIFGVTFFAGSAQGAQAATVDDNYYFKSVSVDIFVDVRYP